MRRSAAGAALIVALLCAASDPARDMSVSPPPLRGTALAAQASQSRPAALPEGAAGESVPETDDSGTPATPPAPVNLADAERRPVRPHMEWLLDPTGKQPFADMLLPARRHAFAAYPDYERAFGMDGLPRAAGAVWLRFELAPQTGPGAARASAVLDLNTRISGQTPDRPEVWLAAAGASSGTRILPSAQGLYPLPVNPSRAFHVYIRLNGWPGPGFAPLVRAESGLTSLDLVGHQALLIALAACLLICLVRGIAERREWRMWAALYAGAVWVQAFWGLPGTAEGVVNLQDMPGLLAPGVALLILPHVGRHLMHTREQAPLLDMQLILLALPGLALTLVPLMPGQAWTARYLPLWPLCALPLLPTVLAARVRRLPGARRFFLICLLPPLGTLAFLPDAAAVAALLPETAGIGALSLAPLACLALSVLAGAFIRNPRITGAVRKAASGRPAGARGDRSPARRRDGAEPADSGREEPLSLTPISPERENEAAPLLLSGFERAERVETPARSSRGRTAPQKDLSIGFVEQALRTPLDAVLREICALDQSRLSPEARRHADALGLAGRNLAELVGNLSSVATPSARPSARRELFDLHELMLQAHDGVADAAAAKNLALSWFTAPYLPRRYEGNRAQIAEVLVMLAESAVRATARGLVQIRVQRVPESTDPGHLLFTVSDSGKGAPPLARSSLAFVRAWELVGSAGGSVSMESGPGGTSISFSVRLAAQLPYAAPAPLPGPARAADRPSSTASGVAAGAAAPGTGDPPARPDAGLLARLPASALRIILVSQTPANRRMLAYYLDELPHEVLESRNAEEAEALYARAPGALIIFDDDVPEEDVVRAVASIRQFEGEHNFPLASILALVDDEAGGERLRRAGCTHALLKPVARKELRLLTLRLAPVPKRFRSAFMAEASTRPDVLPGPRPDGMAARTAGTAAARRAAPAPTAAPQSGAAQALAKQPTGSAAAQPFVQTPTPETPPEGNADAAGKPRRGLLPSLFAGTRQKNAGERGLREAGPASGNAPARALPLSAVGEPMPVPKKNRRDGECGETPRPQSASRPEKALAPPRLPDSLSRAPADVAEWVGEPMPITGKTPSAALSAPEKAAPEQAPAKDGDLPEPPARQTPLSPPDRRRREADGTAGTRDAAVAAPARRPAPARTTDSPAPGRADGATTAARTGERETPPPARPLTLKERLFGRRPAPAPQPVSAPPDAVEWVGEPMPILKKGAAAPASKPAATSGPVTSVAEAGASAPPPDALEWVGEPVPVVASGAKTPSPCASAESGKSHRAEILSETLEEADAALSLALDLPASSLAPRPGGEPERTRTAAKKGTGLELIDPAELSAGAPPDTSADPSADGRPESAVSGRPEARGRSGGGRRRGVHSLSLFDMDGEDGLPRQETHQTGSADRLGMDEIRSLPDLSPDSVPPASASLRRPAPGAPPDLPAMSLLPDFGPFPDGAGPASPRVVPAEPGRAEPIILTERIDPAPDGNASGSAPYKVPAGLPDLFGPEEPAAAPADAAPREPAASCGPSAQDGPLVLSSETVGKKATEPAQAPPAERPLPPGNAMGRAGSGATEAEKERDGAGATDAGDSDADISAMSEALEEGRRRVLAGQRANEAAAVREGAARIARAAEGFALHSLADLARCVEEAASGEDMDEVASIVPELITAVDRALLEQKA